MMRWVSGTHTVWDFEVSVSQLSVSVLQVSKNALAQNMWQLASKDVTHALTGPG